MKTNYTCTHVYTLEALRFHGARFSCLPNSALLERGPLFGTADVVVPFDHVHVTCTYLRTNIARRTSFARGNEINVALCRCLRLREQRNKKKKTSNHRKHKSFANRCNLRHTLLSALITCNFVVVLGKWNPFPVRKSKSHFTLGIKLRGHE